MIAGLMRFSQRVMFAPSWALANIIRLWKNIIPIVVTGFEPVDLLEGILMTVKQLENTEYKLENQYTRVVESEGNKNAIAMIQ